MDVKEVLAMLQKRVDAAGGQDILAERIGVSARHISAMLHGERLPTGRVLAALSLKRVTAYKRVRYDE